MRATERREAREARAALVVSVRAEVAPLRLFPGRRWPQRAAPRALRAAGAAPARPIR